MMKDLDESDLLFKLRWLGRPGNLYTVESRLRGPCVLRELSLVIRLKKSDSSTDAGVTGVTERGEVTK